MYQAAPISPRIRRIRERRREHDSGHVVLCGERTDIYTRYYQSHEAEHAALKRAGALYAWCDKHAVRLEEDELSLAISGATGAAPILTRSGASAGWKRR